MRITPAERRRIDRRLRSRIAPILRAGLLRKAPQVALIVAATITVSPDALAKVKKKQAEPVFLMEAEKSSSATTYTKTYKKEDLKDTMPANPTQDLGDRIRQEVTGLFKRMAAQQKGKSQQDKTKALRSSQPDPDNYFTHLDAMRDAPTGKNADGGKVAEYMTDEMSSAVNGRVRGELDFINTFNKGMNFDLDLGSLFSGGDSSSSAKTATTPKKGKVRYGLILKDINHDNSAPSRAAINDMQDELEFAGHADVEWTIGPVDEASGRRVFNFKDIEAVNEARHSEPEKKSFWDRINLPSFKFKGSAKPDALGNLQSVDGDKLPNWNLQLKQAEGLYTLDYKAKTDGTKLKEEHTFRVPIFGTLELGRRFDDKWDVLQTSAYNILIDKRMPIVSVHYLNLEERYQGTASYKIKDHDIGLTVKGKAEGTAKDPKESYSLKYSKKF